MKPFLFETILTIIGDAKCDFIGEVGTHKGGTAKQFINHFAPKVDQLTYYGYDIFDGEDVGAAFHKQERNGKSPVTILAAERTLTKIRKKHKNVKYKLHKGFTTDTMSPTKFDFVYIDGGHSYDTVKHDYSMVKDSTLIVFDDVKIKAINVFIKELIAEGVDVEIVRTESKHIWAVIRN